MALAGDESLSEDGNENEIYDQAQIDERNDEILMEHQGQACLHVCGLLLGVLFVLGGLVYLTVLLALSQTNEQTGKEWGSMLAIFGIIGGSFGCISCGNGLNTHTRVMDARRNELRAIARAQRRRDEEEWGL